MANITLEDALAALNNGVSSTAATDAQLEGYYIELMNDDGEIVDKQPLSRINEMALNYALGDGLEDIAEGVRNYQPIEFEKFYKNTTRMLLGSQTTRGGQQLETGTAKLSDDAASPAIMGMTFVWNQLFDGAGKEVQTINGATYYSRINGVKEVFTSDGNMPMTSQTATDMLINLTHLYGANPLNLPLTLEQFETLFPLDYYEYSEPRLMHCCVTGFASDGTDKDGNVFHQMVDIPITTLTGKLNGEGESVVIFPDGMAGASSPDTIYKENGVWKAELRNYRIFNLDLSSQTWAVYAENTYYHTFKTIPTPRGTNSDQAVSNAYMGATRSQLATLTKSHGYFSIYNDSGNTRLYISKADKDSGNLPTVNIAYTMLNAQTYILDNQEIFEHTFPTANKGSETTYPVNGSSPVTAPLRMNIQYPVIDYDVKRICVENWGGNYFDGEITPAEAARVTTLADKFYNNDVIETFGELKQFTGLASLMSRSPSGNYQGQFYSCELLKKAVIPSGVTEIRGAFRNCTSLTTIANYLTDWSTLSYTYTFRNCSSLTTITGTITGINAAISFEDSPLTRVSALVILNGLADRTGQTQLTLTLSSTTKALLTEDDYNIAEGKNWEIA